MNAAPVPVVVRGGVFAFAEFEIDVPGFELRGAGGSIPLEPQVFEVLAFLVQNAGRALSKEELLDHVWPERYVTEAALNSRIMAARKALGDNGREQRFIKTVHGRGYRFAGILQEPESALVAAPGSAALSPGPGPALLQLDVPATSFVGREREIERLLELVGSDARLISIVGAGGMGKTRLATEMAARLAASGRPVAFAALETSDDRTLLATIASATGFKPRTTDVAPELVQHLAGTELVLVLDNLEHVIDGARRFLQELLTAAPRVQVIATSRVVVGLRQEWVYRAGGLAVDAGPGETPEAVQLFVDRARQSDASLDISATQVDSAGEICRLVDGMPLAIELAAALTRYLGLEDVARLVRNDVSALAVDLPDTPSRHQSIIALMEESLRHLSDRDRQVLGALAVFEGSFTCDAAGAVAGASLLILRSFADRSLVQCNHGRFALHPLMRQFLASQGVAAGTTRAAHAAHYARFLAAQASALEGDGQVAATGAIDAEFPNVLAAWRWACAERRVDLLDAARYPLFAYLTFRSRFFEANEMAQLAIAALEAAEEPGQPVLAGLLTHYVWILFRIGKPAEAVAAITRARTIFAETGTVPEPGMGTDPLAAVAALRLGAGQYGEAYAAATAALRTAQARGDRIGTAFASWLAGCARLREATIEVHRDPDGVVVYRPSAGPGPQDKLLEAARLSDQAAMILESLGETWLRGFVEIERGLAAGANGDRAAAAEHQHRAYLLRRELRDPQGMGSALIYLAGTLTSLGRHDEVRAFHAEARGYFEVAGDATGLAEVERSEGMLELDLGNLDAATAQLLSALRMSIALSFTNNVLSVIRGLALILAARGEVEVALSALRYVADHPATTPFSRALAESEIGDFVAGGAPAPRDAGHAFDPVGLASVANEVANAVRAGRPGAAPPVRLAAPAPGISIAGAAAHAAA
jgi:DNA-binding winged helix-turn-helix (wHTH) protein/tetratricopeptide (TPR) repeat protein